MSAQVVGVVGIDAELAVARRDVRLEAGRAELVDDETAEKSRAAEHDDAFHRSLIPAATTHGMNRTMRAALAATTPAGTLAMVATVNAAPLAQTSQAHPRRKSGMPGVTSVKRSPATVYKPFPAPPVSRAARRCRSESGAGIQPMKIDSPAKSQASPAAPMASAATAWRVET